MQFKSFQVDMIRDIVRSELRMVNLQLDQLKNDEKFLFEKCDKDFKEQTRVWFSALNKVRNDIRSLNKRKVKLEQLQRDIREVQRNPALFTADYASNTRHYIEGYNDGYAAGKLEEKYKSA